MNVNLSSSPTFMSDLEAEYLAAERFQTVHSPSPMSLEDSELSSSRPSTERLITEDFAQAVNEQWSADEGAVRDALGFLQSCGYSIQSREGGDEFGPFFLVSNAKGEQEVLQIVGGYPCYYDPTSGPAVACTFNHPNTMPIVRGVYFSEKDQKLTLNPQAGDPLMAVFTPFYPGGNLEERLAREEDFQSPLLETLGTLAGAVADLHVKEIAHFAIQQKHVWFKENGEVVLGGWNHAMRYPELDGELILRDVRDFGWLIFKTMFPVAEPACTTEEQALAYCQLHNPPLCGLLSRMWGGEYTMEEVEDHLFRLQIPVHPNASSFALRYRDVLDPDLFFPCRIIGRPAPAEFNDSPVQDQPSAPPSPSRARVREISGD